MSDSIKKHFENDPHYLDNQDLKGTGLKWVTENKQDSIVESVVEKYRQRSEIGIEKYGTTLADSPEDIIAFLRHAQMEMMDGTLYCEKAIELMKKQLEKHGTRH